MFLAVCRGTPDFYEEKKARYMDEPAFFLLRAHLTPPEVEALKAAHAAFFAALRVSEPCSCHPDAPRAGCSFALPAPSSRNSSLSLAAPNAR